MLKSFWSLWSSAPSPDPSHTHTRTHASDGRPPGAVGPPQLDLSQVYPRIFIAGLPGMGPTRRDAHRNNVNDLVSLLDTRYGRGRYLVLNLAPEHKVMYDPGRFHSQVLRFAPTLDDPDNKKIDDGGLPGIEELFKICYAMRFFLDWSPDNVVVLHDDRVRGRSIYVVACYLAWAHGMEFNDTMHAYAHVLRNRGVPEGKQLPTWRAVLKSFQTCIQHALPMLPQRLQLVKIVLSMRGYIEEHDGQVIVEVFHDDELLFDSRDRAASPSTRSSRPSIGDASVTSIDALDAPYRDPDFVFNEGNLRCEIQRLIQGDIQIHISAEIVRRRDPHVVPTPTGDLPDMSAVEGMTEERIERKVLVRYAFHTSLMPRDPVSAIMLSERQVDLPCPSMVVPEGFTMQLTLANPDPHASVERDAQMVVERVRALHAANGLPSPDTDPLAAKQILSLASMVGAAVGVAPSTSALQVAPPRPPVLSSDAGRVQVDWEFAQMLNLRGQLSRLAGVYHAANAHQIFPEQHSVDLLNRKGYPDYFAILALQLAERDMDRAQFILRSSYLTALAGTSASTEIAIRTAAIELSPHSTATSATSTTGSAFSPSFVAAGSGAPRRRSSQPSDLLSPLVDAVTASDPALQAEGAFPVLHARATSMPAGDAATSPRRSASGSPLLSNEELAAAYGPLTQIAYPVISTALAKAAVQAAGPGAPSSAIGPLQLQHHEAAQRFLLEHVRDVRTPGTFVGGMPSPDAAAATHSTKLSRSTGAAADPALYWAALQLAAAIKDVESHQVPAASSSESVGSAASGSGPSAEWQRSLSTLDVFKVEQLLAALRELAPPNLKPAGMGQQALPGAYAPAGIGSNANAHHTAADVTTILGTDAQLRNVLVALHALNPALALPAGVVPASAAGVTLALTLPGPPGGSVDASGRGDAGTQVSLNLHDFLSTALASRQGAGAGGIGNGSAGQESGHGGTGLATQEGPAAGGTGSTTATAIATSGTDEKRPEPHAEASVDLSKYEKMLKMGVPAPAVRHKMAADGVDPKLLDGLLAKSEQPEAAKPAAEAGPDLSKYEKMLKMGIPPPAVRHKMMADGLDGGLLEGLLTKLGRGATADPDTSEEWKQKKAADAKAAEEARAAAAEDAEKAAREQAAADAEAARKQRIEALRQEQRDLVADALAPLVAHKVYGRYFKMMQVGIPKEVVQQKMAMAGMDPLILHLDADKPLPDVQLRPIREDELYGKYFRMLKVGLPRDVVEHKMTSENANVLALELDPELPLPPSLHDKTADALLSPRTAARTASAVAAAKPRRQRKRLHWEALPSDRIARGPTIWSDAARALDESDDDEFIDEELEKLFTQDVTSLRSSKKGPKEITGSSGGNKVVYLIDMKRGRNVGIGLAKLKVAPEALRHCLLALSTALPDGSTLSFESLVLLEELLPTTEEIATVKSYRGDKTRLGEAERFFLAVADVPKARARANALAYQRQFDPRTDDVSIRLNTVTRACDQVRSSKRLRKVLEATLKLGNRLNAADDDEPGTWSGPSTPGGRAGSQRNLVQGFTLNSLLKLSHTKAFNSKITALHFLASVLARKDASALQLGEELPDASPAARITLESIRADLGALRLGLQNVEKLVREQARSVGAFRMRAPSSPQPQGTAAGSTSGRDSAPASAAEGRASSASFADGEYLGSRASFAAPDDVPSDSERMVDFVGRAQARLAQLGDTLEGTQSAFADLLVFFGEDEHMNTEMFFTTLVNFVRALERARNENTEEDARKAREARRAALEASVPRGHGRNASTPLPAATPALLRSASQPARLLGVAAAAATVPDGATDMPTAAEPARALVFSSPTHDSHADGASARGASDSDRVTAPAQDHASHPDGGASTLPESADPVAARRAAISAAAAAMAARMSARQGAAPARRAVMSADLRLSSGAVAPAARNGADADPAGTDGLDNTVATTQAAAAATSLEALTGCVTGDTTDASELGLASSSDSDALARPPPAGSGAQSAETPQGSEATEGSEGTDASDAFLRDHPSAARLAPVAEHISEEAENLAASQDQEGATTHVGSSDAPASTVTTRRPELVSPRTDGRRHSNAVLSSPTQKPVGPAGRRYTILSPVSAQLTSPPALVSPAAVLSPGRALELTGGKLSSGTGALAAVLSRDSASSAASPARMSDGSMEHADRGAH